MKKRGGESNQGIDPTSIQRPYLLRYFDRMAILKAHVSGYRYHHLTRGDLYILLYYANDSLSNKLHTWYYYKIKF